MLATLFISLGAFTCLYFALMGQRVNLEKLRDDIDRLKKDALDSD